MDALILTGYVNREADAVCCPDPCFGYAESVDVTDEENSAVGCTRFKGCCARAFVCKRCGKRLAAKAEAPDYR